jgi:hypothetical protein
VDEAILLAHLGSAGQHDVDPARPEVVQPGPQQDHQSLSVEAVPDAFLHLRGGGLALAWAR